MQHTHPAELGRFLKSEVTTKVRKMHDIVIIKHIHFNKKTKAVGLKEYLYLLIYSPSVLL